MPRLCNWLGDRWDRTQLDLAKPLHRVQDAGSDNNVDDIPAKKSSNDDGNDDKWQWQ